MSDIVDQIDQALGRYFALKGNNDYFDDDGNGLFKLFAEDNGIEDETGILDELGQEDPSECMFQDAFEDFPGMPKHLSEDDKPAFIVKIIQKCFDDPSAYTTNDEMYEPLQVDKPDFNLDKKDKEEAVGKHTEQCPGLFDKQMTDDSGLLEIITVGHKLQKPYLQYVVDTYDRDRVMFVNENPENSSGIYTAAKWATDNPHMQKLKKMDPKNDKASIMNKVIGGIESFQHRVSPKLALEPMSLIQDSLKDVSEQICAAVIFVHKLAGKKNQTCPFQYDAAFAFNDVQSQEHTKAPIDDDDDDDDDEDEKDDPDNDDVKFFDCFNNIKQKLKDNKRLFVSKSFDGSKTAGDGARIFDMQFKEFRDGMGKKYNDADMAQTYPRTNRFCSIIDRRSPKMKGNENKDIIEHDELIMYEPDKGSDKFPNNKPVPMFYFETSRKNLLPGSDVEKIDDEKKKLILKPINALDPCKGGIMTLSFHVESAEVIRCYLYINGQCTRFMPEDILLILPRYFDKAFGDNETWNAKNKDAQRLINEMSQTLKDVHFNAFLSANRSSPVFKNEKNAD